MIRKVRTGERSMGNRLPGTRERTRGKRDYRRSFYPRDLEEDEKKKNRQVKSPACALGKAREVQLRSSRELRREGESQEIPRRKRWRYSLLMGADGRSTCWHTLRAETPKKKKKKKTKENIKEIHIESYKSSPHSQGLRRRDSIEPTL